jgi:mannose-6-phosphate isomerase-like protein (cupin superfamily)
MESKNMAHTDNPNNFNKLIQEWDAFLRTSSLETLIEECEPIVTANGLIYELPNYLQRKDESFAIVDMRHISASEPHYHVETEVYFVLQGGGVIVVGGQEQTIVADDIVVIPSNLAHFVIPNNECVIAIVNTPPFNPDHYKVVTKTDPHVCFDQEQFLKLKHKQSIKETHE